MNRWQKNCNNHAHLWNPATTGTLDPDIRLEPALASIHSSGVCGESHLNTFIFSSADKLHTVVLLYGTVRYGTVLDHTVCCEYLSSKTFKRIRELLITHTMSADQQA